MDKGARTKQGKPQKGQKLSILPNAGNGYSKFELTFWGEQKFL